MRARDDNPTRKGVCHLRGCENLMCDRGLSNFRELALRLIAFGAVDRRAERFRPTDGGHALLSALRRRHFSASVAIAERTKQTAVVSL